MNAVINEAGSADIATEQDTGTWLGRARRVLAGALLTVLLSFGFSAAIAVPASAAGAVSYCFKHTNGAAYTYDTYLQLQWNGNWYTVQNMGRSVNGCSSFSITGSWQNYPARMLASYSIPGRSYAGTTAVAPAGWGSYNLGTGWVNM